MDRQKEELRARLEGEIAVFLAHRREMFENLCQTSPKTPPDTSCQNPPNTLPNTPNQNPPKNPQSQNPHAPHAQAPRVADVIVSLTTYPARIDTLHYTLYTIFTQSLAPKRVLLWLSKEEFENEESLPPVVREFAAVGLEICWCEGNIKSYKKLIYTLKAHPHEVIITADDDVLYHKEWLERLYSAYEENPRYVHCHRAHRIGFDKCGAPLPYLKWDLNVCHDKSVPSFLNLPTGVGGILYPPMYSSMRPTMCPPPSLSESSRLDSGLTLHADIFDEEKFLELCPLGDDFWFWAMALLQGTKINIVKDNLSIQPSFVDVAKAGALWLENARGRNDEYLANLLAYYPLLKERVRFSSGEYWEIRYKSHALRGGGVLNLTAQSATEMSVNEANEPKVNGGKANNIGASGAGSYGRLASFKAAFLNDFVKAHGIESVIEWGCGDGNQLSLAQYPRYVGIDVSPCVIKSMRLRYGHDHLKTFYLREEYAGRDYDKADLSLSLDVIFHLVEDEVFEEYMRHLFASSGKFVIIYSSNKEEFATQHVRHRDFGAWVSRYMREWRLCEVVKNPYPYDVNAPNESSFCDFYVYCRA